MSLRSVVGHLGKKSVNCWIIYVLGPFIIFVYIKMSSGNSYIFKQLTLSFIKWKVKKLILFI